MGGGHSGKYVPAHNDHVPVTEISIYKFYGTDRKLRHREDGESCGHLVESAVIVLCSLAYL